MLCTPSSEDRPDGTKESHRVLPHIGDIAFVEGRQIVISAQKPRRGPIYGEGNDDPFVGSAVLERLRTEFVPGFSATVA